MTGDGNEDAGADDVEETESASGDINDVESCQKRCGMEQKQVRSRSCVVFGHGVVADAMVDSNGVESSQAFSDARLEHASPF